MSIEIYLDNSATTKAYDEVIDIMATTLQDDYGNPSSAHKKGMEADRHVITARSIIAKALGVKGNDTELQRQIFFTSGGTESDNWALIGAAEAGKRQGQHLITTRIEHPAVLETMAYLESQGYQVTYLPVDSQGLVSVADVEAALREDTILVSIMYVNNEVGSTQPIAEIGTMLKAKHPGVLFHVDAVQAFGKYPIRPEKQGIDLLSVSGHKIHGPKGIGFLYIGKNVKIKPILHGGGQQLNYRSGTINSTGIAGLGKAVELIYRDLDENVEKLYALKEYFVSGLRELPDVIINSCASTSAPHIINASITGIRSAVLLNALGDKGIYASAGSACASDAHAHNAKTAASGTLSAMGVKKELLESTIRFSLSEFTTREEIDATLAVLRELVPMLRRYTRK